MGSDSAPLASSGGEPAQNCAKQTGKALFLIYLIIVVTLIFYVIAIYRRNLELQLFMVLQLTILLLAALLTYSNGMSAEKYSVPPPKMNNPYLARIAAYDAPGHGPLLEEVGRWPGALSPDQLDSIAPAGLGAGRAGYGARDRGRGDALPEGNRFRPGREAAPASAPPCLDDEANDDEIDGDERMVYSGLSRNDATRVTAGTMNRRRMMDPYLREEVEQREDDPWWGRHEE